MYRPSTGRFNVITFLKETIIHYNQRPSDVLCTMIDFSQAYDRFNINTVCTELGRTELPEQITNIIEYMCGNTFGR